MPEGPSHALPITEFDHAEEGEAMSNVAENLEPDYQDRMARAWMPEHLRDGLERYLVHGILPGPFLTAVLENDLAAAMARADDTSRAALFEIVSFLYNDAPAPCWGSPAKVEAWMQAKRDEAREAIAIAEEKDPAHATD